MLKPIERNPRPANPVRPNPEPDFQAAVQRALAARAAAEGRPPKSHGYETAGQVRPGDALERLVGPDGVPNNGQFRDPNLIHPGEIYFQQGNSPVSAQTEGVIDTALAYDRKNGANAPDSQRNWDAVQSTIAGELRQTVKLDANGQLQLTAEQQAKLQALNSWAVGTDRLSLETQQALTQVDGEVQQKSRNTTLDQSIAAIQGDLDKVNHKLDDQSFVRKGWGWVTPGKSSGEEFQDFLEDKLDDLKQLKANDTGLPQPQYEQKVNAVLGNFDQEFQDHAKAMEDSDKTWNTIGEVGRVVAATTVGIVATAATGGNVVAGFAAGFGTYELIDAAGDISAVAQGKDMYADGHSSIIGFGMDAAGWDGAKGDGAGVSWDHTKATLKDTAIDAVSSISTAGATTAGMKVTAAVGTRLGATALPNLGARVLATSAGGTAGQAVNGTGQLATDATRLAFDNKLFTAEGGQQMLNSAKTQGIYLATAPVTGAVSGAIPIQRVVSPAATGTTQATQQAAGDVTRLSRLGVTAQFGNDVVSNLGGAELVAQLTQGRHMNRDEAISSVMGAVPGTAQNLAMHPQMMQRVADRRDMLQANGGVRQEGDVPKLWGWQNKGPEFRLGAQVRILGSADPATDAAGAPQLGQPTMASFGGAISTKTNYRAIGQSVIDSLVMGSTKPLRLTLGKELTVSQRPREYRNVTLKEAGLMPTSNQTVFQIKGSTVLKQGEQALLATDPTQVKADFMPTLQGVRTVGEAADGSGTVMQLNWGAMLPDAQTVRLEPGEMDLLGTVAGKDTDAFVEVPQDISFTKLMEEQKAGLRPRAWTNFIPGLNKIWRVGAERRPEDNITVTIPKGTKLSQQAWEQMQATYERLSMRTRIVVDDDTKAASPGFGRGPRDHPGPGREREDRPECGAVLRARPRQRHAAVGGHRQAGGAVCRSADRQGLSVASRRGQCRLHLQRPLPDRAHPRPARQPAQPRPDPRQCGVPGPQYGERRAAGRRVGPPAGRAGRRSRPHPPGARGAVRGQHVPPARGADGLLRGRGDAHHRVVQAAGAALALLAGRAVAGVPRPGQDRPAGQIQGDAARGLQGGAGQRDDAPHLQQRRRLPATGGAGLAERLPEVVGAGPGRAVPGGRGARHDAVSEGSRRPGDDAAAAPGHRRLPPRRAAEAAERDPHHAGHGPGDPRLPGKPGQAGRHLDAGQSDAALEPEAPGRRHALTHSVDHSRSMTGRLHRLRLQYSASAPSFWRTLTSK